MPVEVGRVGADARRVVDHAHGGVVTELDGHRAGRVVDEEVDRRDEPDTRIRTPDADVPDDVLDVLDRRAGREEVRRQIALGDIGSVADELRIRAESAGHVQQVRAEALRVEAIGEPSGLGQRRDAHDSIRAGPRFAGDATTGHRLALESHWQHREAVGHHVRELHAAPHDHAAVGSRLHLEVRAHIAPLEAEGPRLGSGRSATSIVAAHASHLSFCAGIDSPARATVERPRTVEGT